MIPHMLSNHNLSLNILPPLFYMSKLPLTGMVCTSPVGNNSYIFENISIIIEKRSGL